MFVTVNLTKQKYDPKASKYSRIQKTADLIENVTEISNVCVNGHLALWLHLTFIIPLLRKLNLLSVRYRSPDLYIFPLYGYGKLPTQYALHTFKELKSRDASIIRNTHLWKVKRIENELIITRSLIIEKIISNSFLHISRFWRIDVQEDAITTGKCQGRRERSKNCSW